jgi:heat-inducible transcriptional repressor
MAPAEDLGQRKGTVLRAVVTEHIRTGEPVGSGAVVTRYRLRVSPATIRNDMAALEDLGYLAQPHTSAGRVPTDPGYRYYVDTSPRAGQLREAHRQAISNFFGEAQPDLDEVVRGTTQLLSELTHHAAVALAPSLQESTIARLDLMRMGPALVLLVIADTGRVEKRVLDAPHSALTPAAAERLGSRAEQAAAGRSLRDAAVALDALARGASGRDAAVLADVAAAVAAMAGEAPSGDVILGGVGNLAAEEGFERRESLRQLFEALDRHAEVNELLRTASDAPDVTVTIGGENPPRMRHASLVIASYRVGDRPLGSIGVVGPTRMHYLEAISAVRAVARRLSEAIAPPPS